MFRFLRAPRRLFALQHTLRYSIFDSNAQSSLNGEEEDENTKLKRLLKGFENNES